MRITLTIHQLSQLLRPVLPLTGDKYAMPSLRAVLLQRHGNHLYATATNQYVLGCKRVEVPDMPADFKVNALVSAPDLAQIVGMFRATPRGSKPSPLVALDTIADSLVLSADNTDPKRQHQVPWLQAAARVVPGRYPKVFTVLRKNLAAGTVGDGIIGGAPAVTFRWEVLSLLRAAQQWTDNGGSPLTFTHGPTHTASVTVQIGDDFIAAVMPVNAGNDRSDAVFRQAMRRWAAAAGHLQTAADAAGITAEEKR